MSAPMSDEARAENALRKKWMDRARDPSMSLDTLPAFLAELAEYQHDYGSICLAVAAAALAAAVCIDRSPRGGITGFQAGAIQWEFLQAWNQWPEDGIGHRLLDLDHLLYPQYAGRFNSIPAATFARLREKASMLLATETVVARTVVEHWKSIAGGVVPFGMRIAKEGED